MAVIESASNFGAISDGIRRFDNFSCWSCIETFELFDVVTLDVVFPPEKFEI